MKQDIGIALVGLLALAGCSGQSTPLTVQEQFMADSSDAAAMDARLNGLSNSAFGIFTDAGLVTYNGYATVAVETADQSLKLLGDTQIVANFSSGDVTGTMTNFVGGETSAIDGTVLSAVPFSGALAISNGLIDGPNRPNQFGASFGGALSGGGNVIGISGPMIGDFRGGPLRNGIVGTSTDLFTHTFLNGDNAEGSLDIVAEADRDF